MKQPVTITRMICLLIVGVYLFLFLSVDPTINGSTAEADDDRSAENRAIVRRIYEEVFNAGKLGQADTLIAAEYIDHTPPGPGGKSGIEGFKQTVRAFRFAFPDLRFTIEEVIAKGDTVVTRTTMHGTHKSDFMSINATGKWVTVAGFDTYRIADGVVVERWGTLDGMTLMQQIGDLPPTAWQYTLLGVLTQEERKQMLDEMSKASQENVDVFAADPPPIMDLVHLDQLKYLFQGDDGRVRLVALLSPN